MVRVPEHVAQRGVNFMWTVKLLNISKNIQKSHFSYTIVVSLPQGVFKDFKWSTQPNPPILLMQPSMGTLNSPSSRVIKDSTPSQRQILRYINFGIGESSIILFLDMVNLHLINIWSMVNLERTCVLLFYYFLYFKVNLDLEKQFSLVNLHPTLFLRWWILTNYFGNELN